MFITSNDIAKLTNRSASDDPLIIIKDASFHAERNIELALGNRSIIRVGPDLY